MTSLSAKKTAYGGLFTAVALIFSYAETFVPLSVLIPIPGFKLGLANICVMLAFFYLGMGTAFFITLAKCGLSAMLFGTPISFLFSLCGGLLAFCFLLAVKYIIKERISFIGVSVACAALHNLGQVCAAALLFADTAVFWYIEWLLPVSLVTGLITGALAMAFGGILEKTGE